MTERICTVAIRLEQDVVSARQRERQIARRLDFEGRDQTRIASAVPEIARNAFRSADDRRRSADAGFHLQVAKPTEAEVLAAGVRLLLSRNGGAGSPTARRSFPERHR